MEKITKNLKTQNSQIIPINLHTFCKSYEQDYLNAPNGRNFYQILFVIEGKGILNYKDRTYALKRGCAFYTSINVPVSYYSTDSLITAFLTVTGDALRDIEKYFNCDGFLFREKVDKNKYIEDLNEISNEFYLNQNSSVLSALCYSFFIKFFEKQEYEQNQIKEIRDYIKKNFTKTLTLDKISKLFGISVSKLSHDFKKEYSYTVFEYILDLRLNYARGLIEKNKENKIKDAALSCGFDDISYFCKAYKNKFGVTPSEDKLKGYL